MIFDYLSEKKQPGTYAGVTPNHQFLRGYGKFAEKNNLIIPGLLDPSAMHSTLLFSFKPLPNYVPITYDPQYIATISGFTTWETKSRNNDNQRTNCLVLLVDCPQLVERHQHLMNVHKATYTFDDYIPHITLSYDIGRDFDMKSLPNFNEFVDSFAYVGEYYNPIDLDYVKR